MLTKLLLNVSRISGSDQYRTEILNAYLFDNLDQVRELTHEWLITYNEGRPHDSLGGIPPSVYRKKIEQQISTSELFS